MKKQLFKFVTLTVFTFISLFSHAQKSEGSATMLTGAGLTIFEDNPGITGMVGLNLSKEILPIINLDFQFAYHHSNLPGLINEKGSTAFANAELGARCYLNSKEDKTRFYVRYANGLGVNVHTFSSTNRLRNNDLGLTMSMGAYIEKGDYVFGVSSLNLTRYTLRFGWLLK